MSDSDRGGEPSSQGLATAVTILLFLGGVIYLLYDDSQGEERREARRTDHEQAVALCTSLGNGVADPACIIERLDAQQEQNRAEHDLKAQQEMARWALLMLFVTTVGVIYIAQTLGATQLTLKEARAATKAAQDAVAATTETGRAQVRAYLSVRGGKFRVSERDEIRKKNEIDGYFTVINVGNSPARGALFTPKLRLSAYTDDGGMISHDASPVFNATAYEISSGADQEIRVWWEGIPDQFVELFKVNDILMNVDISAGYNDVFDVWIKETFKVSGKVGREDWRKGEFEPY